MDSLWFEGIKGIRNTSKVLGTLYFWFTSCIYRWLGSHFEWWAVVHCVCCTWHSNLSIVAHLSICVLNKRLKNNKGTMADTRVTSIISTYQEHISEKPYVLSTTYECATLGAIGVPNKLFIAFLFSDHNVGVQFWKDLGLITRNMVCCKCRSQVSWSVDASVKDRCWWPCRRAVCAFACRASISIRHGTWFQQSNLNFMEVLLLTYDYVHHVPAYAILQEHQFGSATISEWAKLCRETMLPSATAKICYINYYIATNPFTRIHITLHHLTLCYILLRYVEFG